MHGPAPIEHWSWATFGDDGEEASPAGNEAVGYEVNALNQYEEINHPRVFYVTGNAPASPPPSIEVNGTAVNRESTSSYWSRQVVSGTGPVWAPATVVVTSGATSVSLPRHVYVPPAVEAPVHDEDGNLIEDGRWVYHWDGENRLRKMTTLAAAVSGGVPDLRLSFAYDGQSRRIRKLVEEQVSGSWVVRTDTRFVYDGWNLMAEVEYLGTAPDAPVLNSASPRPYLRRTYLWGQDLSGTLQGAGGVGGLLAMKRHEHGLVGAKEYWATWDLNGNVIGLMDASGLRAAYDYDPFGNPLRVNEPEEGLCPVRFSTKYTDGETGLVYYGYRYYEPRTGRWVNRDPIEEQGGINLYEMVGNDPVNRWDYLGLIGGWGVGNPVPPPPGFPGWDPNYRPPQPDYSDRIKWWKQHVFKSSIAREMLDHYVAGSGAEKKLTERQMWMATRKIDLMYQGHGKNNFVEKVKTLSGGTVELVDVTIPQLSDDPLALGQYTIKVSGCLAGTPSNWEFLGSMAFKDEWDFEFHWGDTKRPFSTNVGVAIADLMLPGQGYPVSSETLDVRQAAGWSQARWSGSGKSLVERYSIDPGIYRNNPFYH